MKFEFTYEGAPDTIGFNSEDIESLSEMMNASYSYTIIDDHQLKNQIIEIDGISFSEEDNKIYLNFSIYDDANTDSWNKDKDKKLVVKDKAPIDAKHFSYMLYDAMKDYGVIEFSKEDVIPMIYIAQHNGAIVNTILTNDDSSMPKYACTGVFYNSDTNKVVGTFNEVDVSSEHIAISNNDTILLTKNSVLAYDTIFFRISICGNDYYYSWNNSTQYHLNEENEAIEDNENDNNNKNLNDFAGTIIDITDLSYFNTIKRKDIKCIDAMDDIEKSPSKPIEALNKYNNRCEDYDFDLAF